MKNGIYKHVAHIPALVRAEVVEYRRCPCEYVVVVRGRAHALRAQIG